MIKYGIINRIEDGSNIRLSSSDIVKYKGDIFRILVCDTDLDYIMGYFRPNKLFNGRVLKFDLVSDREGVKVHPIYLVDNVKSEKEYNRIKKLRAQNIEQVKVDFLDRLTSNGLSSALSLLYCNNRKLRCKTSMINTILGRTVNTDFTQNDIVELSYVLGYDLISEIRSVLSENAGIEDMISLIDFGQKKFVKVFGLKMIGFVNGYYNRGNVIDLLLFGQKLGYNLLNDIKAKLFLEKDISSSGDFMSSTVKTFLKYRKYFSILLNKNLNNFTRGDMFEISKILW